MDSSTSSQSNQPYSPLNRVNLDTDFEQLMYSQDYSMGHGSGHGSAPVDDDSPVEEIRLSLRMKETQEECDQIGNKNVVVVEKKHNKGKAKMNKGKGSKAKAKDENPPSGSGGVVNKIK
ncbi:hypothetical protein Tco_1523785 [Tanacetum coccineum]